MFIKFIFHLKVTTGASNDLERASEISRAMVTKYGMSDEVGLLSLSQGDAEVFMGRDFGTRVNYSGTTAAKIDSEMRNFLDAAHATAEGILTTHRAVLNNFAEALLKKETLEKSDIDEIFKDLPKWKEDELDRPSKPELAYIDPPTVGVYEPELVGASRRVGALSKVRNRAGRAIKGAKEGLRGGDDDVTPPKAPTGVRPRPRPQGSPT